MNFNISKKTYSKELEIDATNGDVDTWGNGLDVFYIFCPYHYDSGDGVAPNRRWRFNDGYVYEDKDEKIGVELLRYYNNHGSGEYRKGGYFTDHNGFFFAWAARGDARYAEVEFFGKLKCVNNGSVLFKTKSGDESGGFLRWVS